MKKVVVPGELVTAERKRVGHHVYVKEGKIYSTSLGLADDSKDTASVIPLEGPYNPQETDLIVGVVVSENFGAYKVSINTAQLGTIVKSSLRDPLEIGNVISAKVSEVNELGSTMLDNVRVFYGGELMSIPAVKVPRVIGRSGSMLDVLKGGTGCTILVGRNGWVWAKGGNTSLLKKAIAKIENEAHTENLTNRIEDFLREENSGTKGKKQKEKIENLENLNEPKEGMEE